jgi:hypothetical protein
VLALAAAGCTSFAPQRDASPRSDVARCERAFAVTDEAIERAGVGDGYGARVPGFAYLRVDRFLASFAAGPLTEAEREHLVQLMIVTEREARETALDNLPRDARRALDTALAHGAEPRDAVHVLRDCAETLRGADAAPPASAARITQAARVPDDYETWKRVVGLYPLAAIPFSFGVRRYEEDIRSTFAVPPAQLPVRGALTHYVPRVGEELTTGAVAALLARVPRDPLGVPQFTPEQALALAWTFAPNLVIDVASDDDRPGEPTIGPDRGRTVNPERPLAYVRIAYARVGRVVLPQVVYTFWFRARPKTSAYDLLGGRVDGLIWRVTIGDDGRPLVFDSIHPCGCYHQFFPTPRAALRPIEPTLEETAFVPQHLPVLDAGRPIALRIESGTHYLQRILLDVPVPPTAQRYALVPDGRLRRLPQGQSSTASFFGPDGIVAGTERGERYFFWPMGIPDPGAMRQWTRHSTAFIGRRHFDEPFLLERYFEFSAPGLR